jgi:hypothetical protein
MRMISAPASANATAIACPMPRVPPVTTAVLPAKEKRSDTEDIVVDVWADLRFIQDEIPVSL